jgi:hypothetical protein
MVLCPLHSAQPSGIDLDPFPDLCSGPADAFPDLEPGQDGPAPVPGQDGPALLPSPVARAAAARPPVMPGLIRPRRKRKRLVIAAALTAVLAVAAGATGPYPWSPGRPGGHSRARITRPAGRDALLPLKNVITQARARQRRRQRRIIIASGATGAAAGWAAGHSGSPPRHRQRSRPHPGGEPAPAPPAERLPGLAALDKGQGAFISGLSCPSAGNCAIDGTYGTDGIHLLVFVASEVRGRWHNAQDIPGLAALGADSDANIGPVSCPSAGSCLAVGYYGRSGQVTAFLAVEQDGTWHNAQPIPGLRPRLPQGSTIAVSCASAGNCAFGGAYTPRTHHGFQAFVDSEANGKWNLAQPIPGLARLATGGHSFITAVSCASPGNCTAGGVYQRQYHPRQDGFVGFVVSETDGVWGTAEQIPGTPARSSSLTVSAISCASAGNCGLTGDYTPPRVGTRTPFVASQVSGTWGDAEPPPGLAALDHGDWAVAPTLSCPAPGECTVGGYYGETGLHPFTVTQTGGTWHTAQQVPGPAVPSTSWGTIGEPYCTTTPYPYSSRAGFGSFIGSCIALSCGSAGNCSAGGQIETHDTQAFTVTQTNGTWHAAQQVPRITALNTGKYASVQDVSCPPAGPCVSAGSYLPGQDPDDTQLFVVG